MPYVIEHYDPNDEKYYTLRAGNPEAADQLKKVLEHLGMKEVTVFEEPELSQNKDVLTVTLLRQDARDLNYWVLRKLDHDCYSESSKLQFERIHKALLKGIHGTEKVPELEKKIKELQEVINNKKTETEYFIGLRKLQAKEKEVISRYKAARTEYFRVKNEHNEIMHEIQKYKESYGVYQSVR